MKPGTSMRGYRYVFLGKGNQRMVAKLVAEAFLGRCPDGFYPDHINRIRCDDRAVTHIDNQRNKSKQNKAWQQSSKFKGVYRHTVNTVRPWIARITPKPYTSKHLGSFSSEIDAAKAYDRAAVQFYGEFALTNKSMGLL